MLHGRHREQRVIAELLARAAEFRGSSLVLRGRPGAGKTALLSEAIHSAGDALVLSASGAEGDSQLAFSGAQQLLSPLLGNLGRIPAPQAAALGVALGLRKATRAQDRFLVSLGTLAMLATAAEERVVIAVVDDAHWLDDASAQALTFAARRVQHERLAFLFAARDDDVPGFDSRGLNELMVDGLDAAAAALLLRDRIGAPVPDEVVSRLVDDTAGNPLALTELPNELTSEQLEGRAPLPHSLPLPGGVQGVFLERVRMLPVPAQELLIVAAADDTGRVDTVLKAARALAVGADWLDAAEEVGLLTVKGGQLRFRHPLVRSAVYQGATSRQRRAAHSALAEALDRADALERRAWHRAAAALEPDGDVAAELERAAATAASRGGFESACALLQRAAELTPAPEGRARRLVAGAEQAWRSGHPQQSAALLGSARRLTAQAARRADIDRLHAWIEMTAGSAATAQELLLQASRDVLDAGQPGALELVAAATETAWILQDRTAAARLAQLSLPPPPDDGLRERFFRGSIAGFQALFADDVASAVAFLRDGIAMAERSDDSQLLSWAGHAAFHVGDDDGAQRLNTAALARARAAGAVGEVLPALQRLAHAELLMSRWNAATASATEARRLAEEIRQEQLAALPMAWLAVIAAHRGDETGFETAASETARLAASSPLGIFDGLVADVLTWARGAQLHVHGHAASALGWLSALSHPVVVRLAALDRIEAALHADQRRLAERWLAPEEAFAAATDAAWAWARVSHCRALLADPASAEEHFEAALDHHRRGHRPFELARSSLAYGRFLRRTRRRVLARRHLRTAADLFETVGAALWAEQATFELRASGETARRRNPATVVDLTPQELQVARQVAQGLPTKDVAAQLFLSPRTVEFHLRNVFTKLGIVSRAELAHLPLDP